jgi:flavin-dependent dehydrogenase
MNAEWSAVIVGASFGGLAAARALADAGPVLVVDRDPVGEGQTSACAAPVWLLGRMGVEDSIEQVHDFGVMHLPRGGGAHRFRIWHRFATFDYATLCRSLLAQSGACFLEATVTGLGPDGEVRTSRGSHRAPLVLDASGWRSVLAERPVEAVHRSLGLELRLGGREDGLHFWLHDDSIRDGYAWDFPAGTHRRVGLLTYGETRGLRDRLRGFLDGFPDTSERPLHGGGLPAKLRDPVAGSVFLVGDAAGQCLPLTGEGIRPALLFGHLAGRLARSVVKGELELTESLRRYRAEVRRSAWQYAVLRALQRGVKRAPTPSIGPLCWLFGRGPLAYAAQRSYWAAASARLLSAA